MATLLGDPICNIEEEEYWENARKENVQANQMYHDEYPYRHLSDRSDCMMLCMKLCIII